MADNGMVGDGAVRDSTAAPQERAGVVLVGLGIGAAVGAVVLGVFAFAVRLPDNYLSDDTSRNTSLFVFSLVLAILAAAAVTVVGIRALVGHEVMGWAAVVPAVGAAVAAYLYLNSAPVRRTGLGVTEGLAVARASWLVVTLAGLLLLAGAAACRAVAAEVALLRPATIAVLVAGMVIGLSAGYGGVLLSGVGQARATAAAAADVPAVPTEVGEQIAYSIPVGAHPEVVPAGAGFVVNTASAVVAYDGATGAERWRYPDALFPEGCRGNRLRSTGTAPGAVVVVECRRHDKPHLLTDGFQDHDSRSLLTAFDAVTGEMLWRNDLDWTLQSRRLIPADAVPVRRNDEFAVLDPRTGESRWTRQFSEDARCENHRYLVALDNAVSYLAGCEGADEALHLVSLDNGDEQTIPLPPSRDPASSWYYEPVAADGDILVVHGRSGSGPIPHALLAIDTSSGDIRPVPLPRQRFYGEDALRSLDYPGPVLQLGEAPDTDAVDLYGVATRRSLRADGVRVGDSAVPENLHWARIGDRLVTATTGTDDGRATMTFVTSDGASTSRPSPCVTDPGGLMPAPGAVLLLCARGEDGRNPVGYDALGLR
jgi:hypothetical protein